MAAIHAGSVLTCTNRDCGCRLRIEEPCPHGDTCACAHPLEPVAQNPLADTSA
jgi:hypothetical protein